MPAKNDSFVLSLNSTMSENTQPNMVVKLNLGASINNNEASAPSLAADLK
jgi:hypothetical protein